MTSSTAGRLLPSVLLALALASCGEPPRSDSQALDPPVPAPDVALRGESGAARSLARATGRPALVTFGYTACPDICPTTLSDWHRLRGRLGRDAGRLDFVFVSVDWRHDTPESASRFARRFDPAFTGLAADSAATAALMPAFHGEAAYQPGPGGRGLELGHTAYSYLLDGQGRITRIYPFAVGPAAVVPDVREVLKH